MIDKNNIDTSVKLNRDITTFSNIDDNLIQIMESKLENILIKHKKLIEAGADWKTPLGLLIAIVSFFGAGEFNKDFLGLPKSYWGGGFIILFLISSLWFLRSVWFTIINRNENIDTLILKIKSSNKSQKK